MLSPSRSTITRKWYFKIAYSPLNCQHNLLFPIRILYAKKSGIKVKGTEISLLRTADDDFISLTDIARHKDPVHTDTIIQNWMRNRNTIELLGFWEMLYNPGFKPLEFEGFKKQAGL